MATETLEELTTRIEGPLRRYENAIGMVPATTADGLRAHRGNMERSAAHIEKRTALAVLSMTFDAAGRGITGY